MIQTALFFILGFLSAMFLAVLLAPTLMRRTERLTRKHIERSMPLKLKDIQADKDLLRAEFAMSTRKLEINAKSLNEKNIRQALELEKKHDEIQRLGEEVAVRDVKIAGLEARVEVLEGDLSSSTGQNEQLTERLAKAEAALEERTQELTHMGRLYDDATFNASNRQIELVAQEARVDQLSGEISNLRSARKESEAQMRDVEAENKTQKAALRVAERTIVKLEKQVARLTTELSDGEEKLERRERELARFKKPSNGSETEAAAVVDDAILRDEIGRLAAEVVNLTATLEGPDSPILKALETPKTTRKRGTRKTATVSSQPSLADRIRQLQKEAVKS